MRGILVALSAALLLSGCGSMPDRDRNMLLGFAAGAGAGALIASAVATGGGSIAAGAAIGGVTGGVIGSMIKPDACYFTNRRGELWQIPCGYHPVAATACYYGKGPYMLEHVECPARLSRVARQEPARETTTAALEPGE